MTSYYVCSDNIDGKESSRVNALIKALEKAGHTAHNGGVGPNTVQSHGLGNGSKGQIGVFIVGGSDAGMYVDFKDGVSRGYYHYKRMIVVFASDTATTDKWITCNGVANTPLVRAHDDNYSGSNIASVGKSAKAYFDANEQYIGYACGPKGCSFDEVVKNFISGNNEGGSSDSSSSGSTIKDAIKDVMYGWDAEAELFVRDDTVYIRKIQSPSKSSLRLIEGENIELNSVSINDINPASVNYLTCEFQDKILTISDDESIKRFGKIESSVTVEDSITKLEDAKEFLEREWGKIRRDNGRSLECKVQGEVKWKQGLWCYVYLPSFNIDDYMYITKVSHDDDGLWRTSLTLVDYPPGFGEPSSTNNDSNDEDSTEDSTESEDTEEETS